MNISEIKNKINMFYSKEKVLCITKNNYKQETINKNYSAIYYMDSKHSSFIDDETDEIKVKYGMFCYIDENAKFENLPIVIGQNPSFSYKKNVDLTNQNILRCLYAGKAKQNCYLLLNTFPIINPDGQSASLIINTPELKKYLDFNVDLFKNLISYLNINEITYQLIVACGESNPVYECFLNALINELTADKSLYCFTHKGTIISHMSMQLFNRKQYDPKNVDVEKCNLKEETVENVYAKVYK